MAMSPRLLRPRASGFKYASLRQGLVAYWPLNETATSGDVTAQDTSGRGNNLTSNNSVLSAAGKVGDARQFVSANSEYLDRASNSNLQFGDGDWSISAWVLPTRTTTGFGHVIGKDQSGGREFGMRPQSNSSLSLNRMTVALFHTDGTEINIQPAGAGFIFSNADFINRWWHFVVTHNAGTVSLFQNGAVAGTVSRTGGKVFAATSTPFNIGRRTFAGFEENFDGTIDEVAKWSRFLSSAEVTELYNNGNGINLGQRS
jgi:hypothetical protein